MHIRRWSLSLLAVAGLTLVAVPASAKVYLFSDFKLHDYDDRIMEALSYSSASIVYFSELASITPEQYSIRQSYERFGCYPFQIVKDGEVAELGYNCYTFFCVGYASGSKVCEDVNGKPFGGVVEINKRLNIIDIIVEHEPFSSFKASDQTDYMTRRTDELTALYCEPYYMMLFDVAVGEGYTCEEVGQYPYFSHENECHNDWRDSAGMVCENPMREDEFEKRQEAVYYREGGSSAASVRSASSSSVSSQPIVTSFPDVIEGNYGFTAIMDLARRGIVRGYSDGSFQPYQTVNRAEFAKLLVGGLHVDQMDGETNCFPDVHNEWFAPYVCAAKRLQWIQGYPDGMFHAERTITKAEAMKIIVASMGVSLDSTAALPPGVKDGQWYTPYIRKAMELKLILESSFSPGADVVRADAAVWIYRSLKAVGA